MSGNKAFAIGFATTVTLFAGMVTYAILPPSLRSINAGLRERGIPELSGLEKSLGHEEGGLFAAWLFVAVEANDQQFEQYRERLLAEGGEHFELGDNPNQVKVVATETFDDTKLGNPPPRIFQKQRLNGSYLPWWNIEQVKEGEFFEKSLPKACWYRVILDRTNKIIYIYWCYS